MCASAFTSIVLPVPAAPASSTVRSAGVLSRSSTDNRHARTYITQQVCKVVLVTYMRSAVTISMSHHSHAQHCDMCG